MQICFGENLKSFRKDRGLTQERFADYFGVSFQAVSKWERGENYPDIVLLPEIADFFGISIEELLGVNRAENEKKAEEYISLYDTMHFRKTSELFTMFQNAVEEFPYDFRILVRYMELLHEEKDNMFIKDENCKSNNNPSDNSPYNNGFRRNPDYEKISRQIVGIYEKIQNNCTDDDIRIWAKHIIINHLIKRYECSYDDATEKWRCDSEALIKAESILKTMPSACDSREYLEPLVVQGYSECTETRKRNIEEFTYLLQDNLIGYCYYPYENNFSPEYKINIIESINSIINIIDSNEYISKNRIHLMYNYGHLGHLYAETGNNEKAVKNLWLSAECAKLLDNSPEDLERISRFYKEGDAFRNKGMCERIKVVMTEVYPLSDKFKCSKEFCDIISFLSDN